MTMHNWLGQQAERQANTWSSSMRTYYPWYHRAWSEPEEHLRWLYTDWNLLDAVKYLNWKKILTKENLRVLDFGCGTGWLSAFLSRYPQIEQIDALDSDKHNLGYMLPEITNRMNGNLNKIQPILGFFSPLLVDDETYDLIVASSSLHHAPNLLETLHELHRALRNDGQLIILNETPLSKKSWINKFNIILKEIHETINRGSYPDTLVKISAAGILYDPFLGDICYTDEYFSHAFRRANLSAVRVETIFPIRKNGLGDQDTKLTHYICTKIHNNFLSASDLQIINFVQKFTMTSKERISTLINGIEYIIKNSIPGCIVECGVWRGGSAIAAMLSLLRNCISDRYFYLYDTFEGMPLPTEHDIESHTGIHAKDILKSHSKDRNSNYWAYSPLEEVKQNIATANYPEEKIVYVPGKVELTIPKTVPEQIALLRLDTDWYESTLHELNHLYPKLVQGGILIIDDYGYWKGAKKAVDEYFSHVISKPKFIKIDDTGIYCIKP